MITCLGPGKEVDLYKLKGNVFVCTGHSWMICTTMCDSRLAEVRGASYVQKALLESQGRSRG